MPTVAPSTARFCPSCGTTSAAFAPGPGGRPAARCPHCGSFERDRFAALLLSGLGPWLSGARVLVDVAPNRATSARLRRLAPEAYLGMDFDPAADGRAVDVRASVTQMPLPDGCVDFLFCYHVLEHVPQDRAAMREISRVLAPTGLALVQVPWRPASATDEDPSAPEAERVRRFGQADHVRYYGGDFEDRLVAAGLDVTRVTPGVVVGPEACALMGLMANEAVWVVRPARGSTGSVLPPEQLWGGGAAPQRTLLSRYLPAAGEDARLREELAAARAGADRWERAYRTLRNRPPVRAMAVMARAARRGSRWAPRRR